MTKTIVQPCKGIEVPPGLLIPEIESDLTRKGFLAGAGSLLVLAPYGCGGDIDGDSETARWRRLRDSLPPLRAPGRGET